MINGAGLRGSLGGGGLLLLFEGGAFGGELLCFGQLCGLGLLRFLLAARGFHFAAQPGRGRLLAGERLSRLHRTAGGNDGSICTGLWGPRRNGADRRTSPIRDRPDISFHPGIRFRFRFQRERLAGLFHFGELLLAVHHVAHDFVGTGGQRLVALRYLRAELLLESLRHAALGADKIGFLQRHGIRVRAQGSIPGSLNFGREEVQLVLLHVVPGPSGGRALGFPGKGVLRHGAAHTLPDPIVLRTIALHVTAADVDAGDVDGGTEDTQAVGGSLTIAEHRSVELPDGHEDVAGRGDAAVLINGRPPGMVAMINSLRRERAPADVVVVLAPAHP